MINTRPKIEIDSNPPFAPAYYQGKWVGIPLFFKPASPTSEGFVPLGITFEPVKRRNSQLGWERIMSTIEEFIIPWFFPIDTLKEICRFNDIPMEWVMGLYAPAKSTLNRQRREKRHYSPIKPNEYRKFIKCLEKINKQSAVIAKIIWFFNRNLKQGGDFVILEDVLRLKVEALSPVQDYQPHWIELQRCGLNGVPMVHWIRQDLWDQMNRQISTDAVYIFPNRKGAPLCPSHINRHFSMAGRLAGIQQPITSLSLRTSFNKKQIVPWENEEKKEIGHLQEVTIEEWEVICQRLSLMIQKAGRKSTHCPRLLLNGILHHLRMDCPFSKLPGAFPWQAVESQYRRWQKNGMLKEILDMRRKVWAEK